MGEITFENVRKLSPTAKHILNTRRYLQEGEKTWDELVERVMTFVMPEGMDTIILGRTRALRL
jgi:hypothetical protein